MTTTMIPQAEVRAAAQAEIRAMQNQIFGILARQERHGSLFGSCQAEILQAVQALRVANFRMTDAWHRLEGEETE